MTDQSNSSRAEQFEQLYNRLDRHLAVLLGEPPRTGYVEKLRMAVSRHSVVADKLADLEEFGRLRNFIVHNRGNVLDAWAEPTAEALAYFRSLVEQIVSPEPLVPRFASNVRVFEPASPLVDALRHMKENDYSQVVVRVAGRYGLLSTEGIARWLEDQQDEDIISVREATVSDAARLEPDWTVMRMSRRHTIEDARRELLQRLSRGKRRVFAVLVSASGKPTERPLGIVTPWDL